MNRTALNLAALATSLLLSSCGEPFTKIAVRHQTELDLLRADLKHLSELVAANPPEKALAAPLNPAPSFVDESAGTSNVAILAWDRLADPEKKFETKEIMDLYLSNSLENIFIWSKWDSKAFETYEADLVSATSLPYLITYKTLKLQEPTVDENLNYTVGGASLGVYLYDRSKKEIVCAFPISALSPEEVSYQYREGDNKLEAARSWARSSLWDNLRKTLLAELPAKVGGSFGL